MKQEINKLTKLFEQLSGYSQSILLSQVETAVVAELAGRKYERQYGLSVGGGPAQAGQAAEQAQAERAFQRGGYGKARYSAELDRKADRQFFQNNAKQDYIGQLFRWHKEGALLDGGRFLAQIPALLKLPGGLTAKHAAGLRRILPEYPAAQPGLAAYPQYTRLEQYLDTRRKITSEVKPVIFSLANSLTKSMTRKEAFEAAGARRRPALHSANGGKWRPGLTGIIRRTSAPIRFLSLTIPMTRTP